MDDSPKEFSKPINRIDEAAYQHDLAYRDAGDDLDRKHEADRIMLKLLDSITDPTVRERLERVVVKAALKAKLFLGVGLDPILNRNELADELHKPYRKPPILQKVIVKGDDEIWSADLVEMPPENLGRGGKFRYILTVIDLYTRYAWAVPLTNKTGNQTKEAFERICETSKRKPLKLWTDSGSEFYNKVMSAFLKKHNIHIYSTKNEGKAVVVERLNRTLKQMMWKQFTIQGHQKWVKMLPEILTNYNNKIHSSIKTTPEIA